MDSFIDKLTNYQNHKKKIESNTTIHRIATVAGHWVMAMCFVYRGWMCPSLLSFTLGMLSKCQWIDTFQVRGSEQDKEYW